MIQDITRIREQLDGYVEVTMPYDFPEDIHIKYPNGQSRKYVRFLKNPRIKDGSIIIVGKKPEEEPFDKTEYAK